MKTKYLILLFSLFLYSEIYSQQALLTVEEAISIALQKNFDLQISKNDLAIDTINNTAGNAGMLPTIGFTGSASHSLMNTDQKYSTGVETKNENNSSTTYSAGIQLNWTVYDGGKMFVSKRKLEEIQTLGEIQFRQNVLQATFNVIAAYFNIVKQKQQLRFVEDIINYNKERLKILQTRFDGGLTDKTSLLQAKIDLNVNLENEINQKTTIEDAKRNLNKLLSRDSEMPFEVSDSISVLYTPNKDEILQKLMANNTGILAFQKQMELADLSIKEYKSQFLPKINLSAAYSYSQSQTPQGSLTFNRNIGPQIGGSVYIPIFQSGNLSRQLSVSRVQKQTAQLSLENEKLLLSNELQSIWAELENQQQLLKIEEDNHLLAKENLEISIQRLSLGQTTSLEVHLAQESLQQSLTRLVTFRYNLKLAESQIKLLISEL